MRTARTVEGFGQAIWDARSMLRWLRDRGAPRVRVAGMSLGGYTAALPSTIEASRLIDVSCTDCVSGAQSRKPRGALVNRARVSRHYQLCNTRLRLNGWVLIRRCSFPTFIASVATCVLLAHLLLCTPASARGRSTLEQPMRAPFLAILAAVSLAPPAFAIPSFARKRLGQVGGCVARKGATSRRGAELEAIVFNVAFAF